MARAAILTVVLAALGVAAAGCGGQAGGAAGTTTTTASTRAASVQAFQTCLKGKGVSLPARPFGPVTRPKTVTVPQTRPRGGFFTRRNLTPAQRKAFQACRGKLPAGGRFATGRRLRSGNPAFAKYTQCLAKHGVKFGVTGDRTKFAKAQAACRALLPGRTQSSG